MKTFQLEGQLRTELGKKAAKSLRQGDNIPAVLYGGNEVVHFTVSQESVRNLVYSPDIFAIDLTIGGKQVKAVLKDLQFHPVSDRILHLDFLQVEPSKPIVMEVPVVLTGHAEGVKAGGKLSLDRDPRAALHRRHRARPREDDPGRCPTLRWARDHQRQERCSMRRQAHTCCTWCYG